MITIHFPRNADELRNTFCDALEQGNVEFDLSPYGTVHEGRGKSPGVEATKVIIHESAIAIALLSGSLLATL